MAITIIAVTNWRNQKTPFGLKEKDRRHHVYIVGKTGMGKTDVPPENRSKVNARIGME
jgi:hypothetical protein